MDYKPNPASNLALEIQTAEQFFMRKTFWAIDDLLPLHRVSLIVALSGVGLTQLACHLISHVAPRIAIDPQEQHNLLAFNDIQAATPSPEQAPIDNCIAETGQNVSQTQTQQTPDPRSEIYNISPAVLLLNTCDQPDVIRPRLEALNVDLHSVIIAGHVTEHFDEPGTPPHDKLRLFNCADNSLLNHYLREHRDIRLVIIDNAESLFCTCNNPSRMLIHRHLSHLQTLCEQRNIAIVLLANIPAYADNPFPTRLLQSLRDCARIVYLLAPDLDDPTARLLLPIKNTLSPTHTRRLHPTKPAIPNLQPQIQNPESKIQNLTYPHYLKLLRQENQARRGPQPHKHDYACEVLQHSLRHGPLPVGDEETPNTLKYLTKQAGVSWRTIERAKQTLQIPAEQRTEGWYWQLPSMIPQVPSAQPPLESQTQVEPKPQTWRSDPQEIAQVLTPPDLPTPSPLPPDSMAACPALDHQSTTDPQSKIQNPKSKIETPVPSNYQSTTDTQSATLGGL